MVKPIFYHLLGLLCLLYACNQGPSAKDSTNSKTGEIQAIVEIPAGTNLKYELNTATNKIEIDQKDGKDRLIDFLPYPANYGYIPGTMMDEKNGGDGDALDVFVLSEHLESGTQLDIKPIGVINIKDNGELDSKIIAIPVEESKRIMKLEKFSDFVTEYHMAQQIIQTWVLGYKGMGETELLGWEDEKAARQLIQKWTKR